MKKHSPEILTGIGIAGMIATTVSAVRATPKALQLIDAREIKENRRLSNKEIVATTWNYIRLLASGGLGKSEKYLVDELQMMLSAMNVEAATVDCDCIEVLRGQQKEGL